MLRLLLCFSVASALPVFFEAVRDNPDCADLFLGVPVSLGGVDGDLCVDDAPCLSDQVCVSYDADQYDTYNDDPDVDHSKPGPFPGPFQPAGTLQRECVPLTDGCYEAIFGPKPTTTTEPTTIAPTTTTAETTLAADPTIEMTSTLATTRAATTVAPTEAPTETAAPTTAAATTKAATTPSVTTPADLCCFWAGKGECTVNAAYMLVECAEACTTCLPRPAPVLGQGSLPTSAESKPQGSLPTKFEPSQEQSSGYGLKVSSSCSNKDKGCAYWSTIGECQKNAAYMFPNCPKACSQC